MINAETRSIGVGCVSLDVEMARAHGWTEMDIALAWVSISAIARATSKAVSARVGHTRQCPVCECWTVPDGPCHLCIADDVRSAAHAARYGSCVCSCGERFHTLAELRNHADQNGGLLHGDQEHR